MRIFFLSALTLFGHTLLAQLEQDDDFLSIMETELKRELSEFSKAKQPPYFLSYRVSDTYSANVGSSFGSLVTSSTDRSRVLVADVKVGDYNFDSSHSMDNFDGFNVPFQMPRGRGFGMPVELPWDNRPEAIQFMLWQVTQGSYRQSLEMFKTLKNLQHTTTTSTIPINDFSREVAATHVDPPLPEFTRFYNEKEWTARIKKISTPFLNNPDLVDGDASLDAGTERKYFVSSEGTRIAQNRTYAHLTIRASIRADDGDVVGLHKSYFAFDPANLPTDEEILQDVSKMIEKLNLLRKAPLAEPYTGPAILYSHAAGVFFHEIFGHRVEGHRLKDNNDGQTFKGKIKEEVLPKSLSVIFDPTQAYFNGQALNGYYLYDDEGIKGQKVEVVKNGILKTFLMSRTPIENLSNSNGHGRAQAGAETVSRQSNLIIKNDKVVPMNELRKMLITECKKQKKKYGYLFMDVVGGFTTTERYMPNAFNIFPTEVFRIYVDGRPDELVRGVDLIGTPLAMFAEIAAADDKSEVFTGFCGAESGYIPVTAVSPSLFVKRIETQKKATSQVEKPILQKPAGN
ncbi:MAG TPA: metallopeptidase TldD-related protein [Cyclobacteriaceae bacterium]|nr:metallopeptidase TldD-related protein [Cyclobacteriaceae bacterium]